MRTETYEQARWIMQRKEHIEKMWKELDTATNLLNKETEEDIVAFVRQLLKCEAGKHALHAVVNKVKEDMSNGIKQLIEEFDAI